MAKKHKNSNYHPNEKHLSPFRKRLVREARSISAAAVLPALILGLALGLVFTWQHSLPGAQPVAPEDFHIEERVVSSCKPTRRAKGLGSPDACLIRFEGSEAPYEPAFYALEPEELAALLPPGTAVRIAVPPESTDLVYLEAGGRVLLTYEEGLEGQHQNLGTLTALAVICYSLAGLSLALLLFRWAVLGEKAFEKFHRLRYSIKQNCPSGPEKE